MSAASVLAVAAGGALGAAARYMISLIPFRGDFPFATLIVNLVGALAIGFIAGFAENAKCSPALVLFLKTGICGGFTTFSTFSLESFTLFESGKQGLGAAYIALSLAGCLAGVWLGTYLGKAAGK